MFNKKIRYMGCLVIALAILPACVPVGDIQEEDRTIPLEDIESAEIELDMGAGELRVQGSSKELFEGTFSFNVKKWKPEIDYHTSGKRGYLRVKQGKSSGIPAGNGKNHWDIYLNEKALLDLLVDFGAGEGKLDLRGLNMKSLEVDMGVGDLTVDLSGEHKQDLDVTIVGGVGSAKVYLPENVGVRVEVDKGIGSVDARGMRKSGSIYTNDAFGEAEITIDVRIDAGIGSISLRLK